MMDIVKVDGKARGIIARNLVSGEIERHSAHAVVIASGGYGNVYFLSTNAMGSNVSAAWKIHKRGAHFANPCYVQIHPTCIPVHGTNQSKLTLMSESLRNSGRIWVPKRKEDAEAIRAVCFSQCRTAWIAAARNRSGYFDLCFFLFCPCS